MAPPMWRTEYGTGDWLLREFVYTVSVPILGPVGNNIALVATDDGAVRLTNETQWGMTDARLCLPAGAVAETTWVVASSANPVNVYVDHHMRATWLEAVRRMCGAAERDDLPAFRSALDGLWDAVADGWTRPIAAALHECTPLDAALTERVAGLAIELCGGWSQNACHASLLHAHYGASKRAPGAAAVLDALLDDPRCDVDARSLERMVQREGLATFHCVSPAPAYDLWWKSCATGGVVHASVASRLYARRQVDVATLHALARNGRTGPPPEPIRRRRSMDDVKIGAWGAMRHNSNNVCTAAE